MNMKIQRMQKRLEEVLVSQEKYLKKAQEAGASADQLKRDILFEENNAIATKVRDLGIRPEDFDAVIANYLKQRIHERSDNGQNETDATPENSITEESEENKEGFAHDSPQ